MKSANLEAWLRRPSLIQELDRELASRRLRNFAEQAWPILEPSTRFIPGWHLDAISEHLQAVTAGQIRNLLINIPPRHMKSLSVAVFWPAWEWTRNPESRWVFMSYAGKLSLRDSVKCRRLIQSRWYQENWGDKFQLTGDQNAKERFENNQTGYRLASSVGGLGTGEGGNRIVCDDPHSVSEAESDISRQGVLDWWDQTMSSRLDNPKTDTKVIVMQRVHEADLSGHVLAQGGYEHLCLPAEYEGSKRSTSIGWRDPRLKSGELLWPDRFGLSEVEALKRSMGSYAAAGQLQQRPAPAEGGILKRHWWRYWQPLGMKLPPVMVRFPDGELRGIAPVTLPEGLEEIQSWDCAFKDLRTSDYVAGGVWGRRIADKFLLTQVRERMDCPATVKAVRDLSRDWPGTKAKLVEDKANGPAVIQMLQHEVAGLIAVNPEGGKEARAQAVSPEIESGNVYLPHPHVAPWVTAFIEECAAFPNGAHDDQVDQMTQALVWFGARPSFVLPKMGNLTRESPTAVQ